MTKCSDGWVSPWGCGEGQGASNKITFDQAFLHPTLSAHCMPNTYKRKGSKHPHKETLGRGAGDTNTPFHYNIPSSKPRLLVPPGPQGQVPPASQQAAHTGSAVVTALMTQGAPLSSYLPVSFCGLLSVYSYTSHIVMGL